MDAVDLEILSLIQNDARVSHASVGSKLGLTAPAVHARIKRLEREGIIRGYLTSISPEAVKQTLLAFVRITNNSSEKDEVTFEDFTRVGDQTLPVSNPSANTRYGLFGLLDHRSSYGEGVFPEPFLV